MVEVKEVNPDSTLEDSYVPINTWTNYNSFGNPSGHAFSSMTIGLALVIDYMQARNLNQFKDSESRLSVGAGEERVSLEREALSKFPFCQKVVLFLSAFFYTFCIGMGRFFLGAHSLDQVVDGWLLGLWLSCSYAFIMREVMHDHIRDLTNLREKCALMTHLWVAGLVYVIIMICLIVTFLITDRDGGRPLEIPKSSEYKLIDDKKTTDYYRATLFDSSWLTSALGGYCGILM